MLFYFIHYSLVLLKQNVCYEINLGVNVSINGSIKLMSIFCMGTLQGEQVEFDSGVGMYLNNLPSPCTKCAGLF